MLNERKNIDNLFRNILSNQEEELPNYVWDNICGELRSRKKRKRLYFWLSAAASFALLVSFGTGYYLSWKMNTGAIAENTENKILALRNEAGAKEKDEAKAKAKDEAKVKAIKEAENREKELNFEYLSDAGVLLTNYQYNKSTTNEQLQPVKSSNTLLISGTGMNIETANIIMSVKPTSEFTESLTGLPESIILNYAEAGRKESIIIKNDNLKQDINTPEYLLLADNSQSLSSGFEIFGQFSSSYSPLTDNKENNFLFQEQEQQVIHTKRMRTFPGDDNEIFYSSGVGIKYLTKDRWNVQSGLFYSQFSESYEHVEVPAIVGFKIIDRRFDLNLTTGLSSGYMVSQGNYEYKPYDFNAISGIGANFTITRRLSFIAQPSVKFNIPIENNFFARRTFLSYALYTGLTFSIK